MCCIHGLVSEYAIDAEQFCRTEAVIVPEIGLTLCVAGRRSQGVPVAFLQCFAATPRCELVQHVRRRGGGVRAEKKFV